MECDCIADRIHEHVKWLFGAPDNFLFAVYALLALWALIHAYMVIADAQNTYHIVTQERHRRRMEEMDKIIELERIRAAAPVVVLPADHPEPPPSPEPAKEEGDAVPPA